MLQSWDSSTLLFQLLSGKRLQNYGKSPFFMGKSTINDPLSIAMLDKLPV